MDIVQRYYSNFDDMKLTTEEVAIVGDMVKEIERLREKCLHLESTVEDRDSMIVQLQHARSAD